MEIAFSTVPFLPKLFFPTRERKLRVCILVCGYVCMYVCTYVYNAHSDHYDPSLSLT